MKKDFVYYEKFFKDGTIPETRVYRVDAAGEKRYFDGESWRKSLTNKLNKEFTNLYFSRFEEISLERAMELDSIAFSK